MSDDDATTTRRRMVLAEIAAERQRQPARGWTVEHDRGHDAEEWIAIIAGYLDRAAGVSASAPAAVGRPAALLLWRRRLIQVAALCVAAVESYDRYVETTEAAAAPAEEDEEVSDR
ncbi:MAG: hypothetical protein IVW57_00010 [Ktedonobacterales bacterium]|nr:hypothetical protein [Ktedonobacterales bacterium]